MDFEAPPRDPIGQIQAWLDDAGQIGLPNPNAMTLATIDPDGRPSARVVLMKRLDEHGLVFYTNRESRKGLAIAADPNATLVFHWDHLHRQIVIEGTVTETDDADSDAYFATRPRASQLGAWASRQSEPVASRAVLDEAFAEAERRFEGRDVTRPPYWGGYQMAPQVITFWQARPFRLHDRISYHADGPGGWTVQRLFP